LPKRILLALLTLVLVGCADQLPMQRVGVFSTDPAVAASVSVNGPDVTVKINPARFKAIPPDQATNKHAYGEGHYHLFLDVPPTAQGEVIPKTAGIYHTPDANYDIHNVTNGHHVLWVELGYSDHMPYEQVEVVKAAVKGSLAKVEFDVGQGAVAQAPPSPEASAAATSEPTSAPTSAPTAAAPPPPGGGGTKVAVLGDPTNGGKYDPASLTIKAGESVSWEFQDDSASHTVTDDGGAFDSGTQSKGFLFTYKYEKAGSFGYSCSIHPNMKGTVTVQ
jgi:plastocyanin